MKSIIPQDECCCYICGSTRNLEEHHIIHGTAGRRIADKLGLTVMLCAAHHRGRKSPHQDKDTDIWLKGVAQAAYEREHSREEWMREVGRNYLEV